MLSKIMSSHFKLWLLAKNGLLRQIIGNWFLRQFHLKQVNIYFFKNREKSTQSFKKFGEHFSASLIKLTVTLSVDLRLQASFSGDIYVGRADYFTDFFDIAKTWSISYCSCVNFRKVVLRNVWVSITLSFINYKRVYKNAIYKNVM